MEEGDDRKSTRESQALKGYNRLRATKELLEEFMLKDAKNLIEEVIRGSEELDLYEYLTIGTKRDDLYLCPRYYRDIYIAAKAEVDGFADLPRSKKRTLLKEVKMELCKRAVKGIKEHYRRLADDWLETERMIAR